MRRGNVTQGPCWPWMNDRARADRQVRLSGTTEWTHGVAGSDPPAPVTQGRKLSVNQRAGWLLLPFVLTLSGCGSLLSATTADVSGIAGAGVASAVTKSPAAAAGIGLGIAAAANAGLQYTQRVVHRAEQNQIAAHAGTLEPGAVGTWSVSHDIPLEDDEHGSLAVTRVIGNASFMCKEIVFSVDTNERDKVERAFYLAMVCRDGETWKWASAEPATERWGPLQ